MVRIPNIQVSPSNGRRMTVAFKVDLKRSKKSQQLLISAITAITLTSVNDNVNDSLNKLRPLIKKNIT